jgi:hypothetical protein
LNFRLACDFFCPRCLKIHSDRLGALSEKLQIANEIRFYMFGIAFAKRVPVAVLFFGWGTEAATEACGDRLPVCSRS